MFSTYDDGQRYDKTPDDILQEIIAGVGGNKDVVASATDFLQSLTKWVTEFIEIIKEFFGNLASAKK